MISYNNSFYTKITWIDNLIFSFIVLICFGNFNSFTDARDYINRRTLLRILTDEPNSLIYIEKTGAELIFRLGDFYLTYLINIDIVSLRYNDLYFINGYDTGDKKIVNKIIKILNTKYHEHQQELIRQASI